MWPGIRDETIEGKLKAIKKVDLEVKVCDFEKPYDSKQIVTSESHIITSLEIETDNGIRNLDFPGLIFPDSIGHKVKYSRIAHQTPPEDFGTYLLWGIWYELNDLDMSRTYKTYLQS